MRTKSKPTCLDCGGKGSTRCDVCTGEGTIVCATPHRGQYCAFCEMSGRVNCPHCYAIGRQFCIPCQGTGIRSLIRRSKLSPSLPLHKPYAYTELRPPVEVREVFALPSPPL